MANKTFSTAGEQNDVRPLVLGSIESDIFPFCSWMQYQARGGTGCHSGILFLLTEDVFHFFSGYLSVIQDLITVRY